MDLISGITFNVTGKWFNLVKYFGPPSGKCISCEAN